MGSHFDGRGTREESSSSFRAAWCSTSDSNRISTRCARATSMEDEMSKNRTDSVGKESSGCAVLNEGTLKEVTPNTAWPARSVESLSCLVYMHV